MTTAEIDTIASGVLARTPFAMLVDEDGLPVRNSNQHSDWVVRVRRVDFAPGGWEDVRIPQDSSSAAVRALIQGAAARMRDHAPWPWLP